MTLPIPALTAVIFDMDGVVLDSQAAANRALVEAAAKHGVRLNVSELEDLVGASELQFWSYVKERYRLPSPVEFYAGSYDEDREIAAYDQTLLSPGLIELLEELRDANLQIAVATSGSRKRMNAVIDLYCLAPWLDVALCREDAERAKPAPDLFLAVVAALRVPPRTCLVIEDSARGIAAARAAGMFVLGFGAYCASDAHLAEADARVDSFLGLDFAELERLLNKRGLG
ncbi:MAG TPA: HAD family phosphatase [Polyangiaceae bacterium]